MFSRYLFDSTKIPLLVNLFQNGPVEREDIPYIFGEVCDTEMGNPSDPFEDVSVL